MAEINRFALDKFMSTCDELITCKYLVAENKIQKLLGALASTPPVYELVSECMEQFNRDREMSKAFIQEGKGHYTCNMPSEEFKVIALAFCVLADVNAGRINFNDFVRRFFSDSEEETPFQHFISTLIVPFRNLLAEAFGYPTIDLHAPMAEVTKLPEREPAPVEEPKAEEELIDDELANKVVKFPILRNKGKVDSPAGLEKLCEVSQRIACQMLDELEISMREDTLTQDLKSMCYAVVIACVDKDFDTLRGVTLGLKYAAKGAKCVKFLVRELVENVEKFYDAFFNLDDDE